VDSQKVPPRSAVPQLAAVLDSPEVGRLVADLEALRWTGRPGYPIRTRVGMALAKSLYVLPTWTRTVRLVREHPGLQAALGCDGDPPSEWARYRFTAKLRDHAPVLEQCIADVIRALKKANPVLGWDVAIDASDMPAYASGRSRRCKEGPERTPDEYSDPDASWGIARGSAPGVAATSTATSCTWRCAPRRSFPLLGGSRRAA
jgi:transposase-like protein DUF772